MTTNVHFRSYQFFLQLKIFQTEVVEKFKTHILRSKSFFFLNRAPFEIMWRKYCRARQATDDNMAHANCALDT